MTKYIYKISLLVIFLFAAQVVWGQLSTNGGTISAGTYTLNSNISLNSKKSYTINAGTSVTINLNGKTINGNASRIFDVYGSLTIKGSGIIQKGSSESTAGCAYIYEGGTLIIENGTIQNCSSTSHGGAIYVAGGGTLIMKGGKIQNNKVKTDASWNFPEDNEFPEFGNASGYGGGVYLGGVENKIAIFKMTGGSIYKNVASSGGGVMAYNYSEFIMDGANAIIEGNIACGKEEGGGLGNGGAVYVQNATFHLKNGSLKGNKAVRYGGAVNTNQSATFKIEGNSSIDGNYANYGGGLTQEAGYCQMTLDGAGVVVKNNKAKNHGGGLMIEKGVLDIKGSIIENNSAGGKGGGASLFVNRICGDIVVNISNGAKIQNNQATESGGGLDLYANPIGITENLDISLQPDGDSSINSLYVNFNDGSLLANKAPTGAGINLSINTGKSFDETTNAATVNLGTNATKAIISSNISTSNGGGIAMNSGTFNISNAQIFLNSATNNGGGMYLGDGTFNIYGATTLTNNSARNGGGIYVGNGTFTVSELGSITARTNHVTNDGGAICLSGGNISSMGDTSFEGNYSGNNGGAVYVSGGNISLKSPKLTGNGKNGSVPTTMNGGAIYLTGSGKSFTSTGSAIIHNNASTEAGGAIYVNGGSVNMVAATLSGNNSKDGGAAYVLNGNVTTTGTTSMTGNYATTDGGAVYVSGGKVTLYNPTISGNGKNGGSTVTGNGGAIYSTGTVTFNGASTINSNSAMNGGAIYTTGTVTLKGSSTMEGNIATGDGGVMFVDGGDILSTDGSNYYSVTAKNNSAFNGGAFRVNGSIDFGYTLMQNNTASGNGGAVALYNGTFKMKNDDGAGNNSTISGNTATNGLGGGLYINNTSSSQAKITWDGGVFTGNEAKAGGAVAAEGSIDLTFAATMENNKAEIGGGLYMNNGVDMKFGAGLVRGNSAAQPETDTETYTTASGKDANSVSGVGGGIFMSNNSTLEFTASDKLGIYNNFATNAGADICANGSSTSIILPDVSNMKLTGFDVPASRLDWMEDYFIDESYISNRTSLSSKNQTGIRYEELLKVFLDSGRNIEDYMVDIPLNGTRSFNNYICLDLGYDLVYVDLTVIGLKDGDYAAIICNYPKDGNPTQYRKLLFKNEDTKQIALPKGYWQFVASDWSYAYNKPSIKAGNAEPTYYDGYVFISNTKDGTDHDAAGKEVQAYKKINVEFNPLDESNPKNQVKQFQKVIVNRMMRKN